MAPEAQLLAARISHAAPLWAIGAAIVLMLGALYFVFGAPGGGRAARRSRAERSASPSVPAAASTVATESVPAPGES